MNNHSASPWRAIDLHESTYRIISANGETIAEVNQVGIEPKERIPNATLIAAAPELLKTLKLTLGKIREVQFDYNGIQFDTDAIESVIAKATAL